MKERFSFILLFILFALSLQMIRCGSAISSLVKLCFTALLLRLPFIIFAEDKLHSGN